MSGNKFDQEIKEKFESRKIQPSAGAWQQIESQLNTAPVKRNRPFVWVSAAAVLVGVSLISFLYFNRTEEYQQSVEQMVIQPVEKSESELQVRDLNDQVEMKMPEKTEIASTGDESVIKSVEKVVKSKPKLKDSDNLATIQEVKLKPAESENFENNDNLIDSKVEELVAQIAEMEEDKVALTDAEVDSLLEQAREDILKSKVKAVNGSVDATALLAEVETELDQSFRDQLFDVLKQRYLRVKTALADRNQ